MHARARSVVGLLSAALLCLSACDDGGGDGEPDTRVTEPDTATDTTPDAESDTDDDAPDGEADVEPDLGPECTIGTRECVDEDFSRVCNDDGVWQIERCPEGQNCDAQQSICVAPPEQCEEGARQCQGTTRPTVCDDQGEWIRQDLCPEGEQCVGQGLCLPLDCAGAAAQESYVGCDYLAVPLPNIYNTPGNTPDAPIGVVLANPRADRPAHVTAWNADQELTELVDEVRITPPIVAGGETPVTVYSELRDASGEVVSSGISQADNLEIPPGGMAILLFESPPYPGGSVVRGDAWRLRTDKPVVAYQFSPYCCNYSFTNDASLLLPTSSIDRDYVYVGAPTFATVDDGSTSNLAAVLTIVGAFDGTRVTVDLPPGMDVRLDVGGEIRREEDRLFIDLDSEESAHIYAGDVTYSGGVYRGPDFSGARIHGSAPIAVFSGHECVFVPHDREACDHLEEQLFPVGAWGNSYVLAPTVLRNPDSPAETTYWKLIGDLGTTTIRFSTPYSSLAALAPPFPNETDCRDLLIDDRTIELPQGTACAFGSRQSVRATSEKPFAVLGMISGQATTGSFFGGQAGDPSIFLVAPERQFRTYYPMLTPTTYANDWLTFVTRNGNPITIDGEEVDFSGWTQVPGTDMGVLHVSVEDGPHQIRGGAPFGVLAYAYDDYVSYAYTGGLDLAKR